MSKSFLQTVIIPPPVNEVYTIDVSFGNGVLAKFIELLPQKDDSPDARQSSQLNWMNVTACYQAPGKNRCFTLKYIRYKFNYAPEQVFACIFSQAMCNANMNGFDFDFE